MIHSSPSVQGTQTYLGSQFTEPASKHHHICIIGDGVESLAVANLLGDDPVSVYPVDSPEGGFYYGVHSFEIRQRGASVCFYRGSINRDLVYEDLKKSVENARAIFVCASATKYGAIADRLHPYLENNQVVCLINSPLGAAFEFQSELRRNDCKAQVSIIEVGRIFDSILVESGVLLISGLRKRIPVSGISRNDTRKGIHIIQSLVDETVPSSNVIERGLTDIERILRPVLALSFLIGHRVNDFDSATVNDFVLRMVKGIEIEVQSLSSAYGSCAPGFLKSIHDFMNVGDIASESQFESLDVAVRSLYKVIVGVQPARHEMLADIYQSVLEEDVKEVYCLLSDLATHAHLPVPVIDSVVDISTALIGKDLRLEGRSVDCLGLVGFDNQEIVDLVNN